MILRIFGWESPQPPPYHLSAPSCPSTQCLFTLHECPSNQSEPTFLYLINSIVRENSMEKRSFSVRQFVYINNTRNVTKMVSLLFWRVQLEFRHQFFLNSTFGIMIVVEIREMSYS